MGSRRSLERRLSTLQGFTEPRVDLEQYPTPPAIAAHLLHLADLHGDLQGVVIDLGAGTGMLALGASIRGADRVVGIERDSRAIDDARENTRRLAADLGDDTELGRVSWVRGDAHDPPLCLLDATRRDVTVVMNPPFGAQDGRVHADREFLETASRVAGVSYSIHNGGSRAFVESFAADYGGSVTHAFSVELDLDRQFDFHERAQETIDAEAFRIEWSPGQAAH